MSEGAHRPPYKVYRRKPDEELPEADGWKKEQAEFERLFGVVESLVVDCHPEIALPVLNAICIFLPRYAGDEPKLGQSELELLQALFLRHKLTEYSRSSMDFDSLVTATDALAVCFFKKRPTAAALFSTVSADEARNHFREKARSSAQFVRNWSQPDRMWELTQALFATIDDEFRKAYKLAASELVVMLKTVTRNLDKELKRKIEAHREKIDFNSFASVKAFYLDLSETFWLHPNDFARCYPGKVDEQALNVILDKWTLQFGELGNRDPEHLFMGNPVRSSPLIKHDHLPGYFLPLPQLFQTFCLEMIQSLIYAKKPLKKQYETKRAQFLQSRVEKLFELHFPSLPVYANCDWESNKENGEV